MSNVAKDTASERSNMSLADELYRTAHAQQKLEHAYTKWEAIKLYPKATFWILATVIYAALIGYENQAGSMVVGIEKFREYFGYRADGQWVLDTQWQSAISGGPSASIVMGGYTGSFVCQKIGRKWTIFAAVLLTIPFVTLEFVATTIQVFFAGKFLNGFCLGVLQSCCTSYITEISPLALRGVAIASINLAQCVGPFLCYVIAYKTESKNSRMSYRAMMIPQFILSAVSVFLSFFMPESPMWLLDNNKDEQATISLNKLYKGDDQVQAQFALLRITLEEQKAEGDSSKSFIDCFRGTNLRRTLVACAPFIMQPMSGVAYIANYSTYYFELAGFSNNKAFYLSIIGQCCSILGVTASLFVIDRFGRRFLALYAMSSLAILNVLTAALGTRTDSSAFMNASSAFIVMYNFFYNSGIGPLAYLFAAEAPTSTLRALTIAIGTSFNNGFQCLWSFVLPYMFNQTEANMGSKINFIFAGCCFISLPLFYLYIPELAHRSMEEIDEMFNDKLKARDFKHHICRAQERAENAYMSEKDIAYEHIE